MTNQLVQYVRDNKNRKIGVLVAAPTINSPDIINVGWSLTRRSAGDKFDPVRGVEIALGRAIKTSTQIVPHSLTDEVEKFALRANRYFKDKQVIISPLPVVHED